MADGLETLNAELIHRLLQEDGLNLYQLEKRGGGGVSKNVWRKVLAGKPVRQMSRVAIGSYLKVEPNSLLLLDRKATLEMVRGQSVVSPRLPEMDRTQPEKEDQPHPGLTVFRGCAEIHELHALDDDGRVGELTRRCYYKIENATLTIRGTEADLIIDNVTMYDDPSCSKEFERSSHRLQGHGPVVDGSVNILYTVEDQTRRLSWAGVCVLNVPRTGKIHGYWMTAGHAERGRTVLGTLELELKPT
jgi:hypothetical protein